MSAPLEPTIGLATAASIAWDVAVIGAGPAGALAAHRLAAEGLGVLLIDKCPFPRRKVCGCCLNAAALAVLDRSGLADVPARAGARPLHEIRVHAESSEARLGLPRGASLSREALDAGLVRAAIASGASFLSGCLAKVTPGPSLRATAGAATVELRTRTVVVADGLAGHAADALPRLAIRVTRASRIGCGVELDRGPAAYQPGAIHMGVGRGGYVGLVRLESDRLDVAAALDPVFIRRRGGPGRAAQTVLDECRLAVPDGLATAPWKGTPALTRRRRYLQDGPVFVIGDAAGYVEPFTGEGMAWALASAEAVTPLVADAVRHGVGPGADTWTGLHHRLLGRRRRLCRIISGALRRPAAVRLAIGALSVVPALASPVVRTIHRMGPPNPSHAR